MKDTEKTKKQLIAELEALRKEVSRVETAKSKRIDRELKEAREYLEYIFKTSSDGIIIADDQWYITMVNEAAGRMLGCRTDELIGKHTRDFGLKGEEQAAGDREIIERVMREGAVTGIERTWLRKEGTSITVEMNIALLRDHKGAITGSVGIVRDISERKNAEQILQKSEARYRELVENANSIILRMDLEGKVTFFNEFAQRFFGYAEEEIIGKNVVGTIVPPHESTGRDLAFMIEDIGHHPERYANNENENICKNGRRVWVAWTNRLLPDDEKDDKEILCIGNDITDRKRAETDLRATKDFLDNVIENSLDSIVISDNHGYITRANRAFLKLLGMNQEEAIGKHLIECSPLEKGVYRSTTGEMITIGDDFFASVKAAMATLLHKGMVANRRTFYRTKDNSLVPVEDSLAFLCDTKGERIGAVGVIRDCTERERAARVIEERTGDLEERVKELTCLFALSRLCQQEGMSRGALFQGIVDLVPLSWHYPERTWARMVIEGEEYTTAGFKETSWKQSTAIVIDGKRVGALEVYFLGEEPESGQAPFLVEEHGLIASIGSQVANIVQLKRAEEKLVQHQNQLRNMASQLSLAEESARRNFAAYLHDQIGQTLFAIKIKLETLRSKMPQPDKKRAFDEIISTMEQVINDTRTLTFEMSMPILYQLGLDAALEWLVEQTSAQGEMSVVFRGNKQTKQLHEEVSVFLFRAVQELLTNVRKHARAHNAEVVVEYDDARILIRVIDDGVGCNPGDSNLSGQEKGYGFGLFSLRERLMYLGGQLTVESEPHQGTAITLMVPLAQ